MPYEPKELIIIPNAVHVDLYDKVDVIPFEKLETFLKVNLKEKSWTSYHFCD